MSPAWAWFAVFIPFPLCAGTHATLLCSTLKVHKPLSENSAENFITIKLTKKLCHRKTVLHPFMVRGICFSDISLLLCLHVNLVSVNKLLKHYNSRVSQCGRMESNVRKARAFSKMLYWLIFNISKVFRLEFLRKYLIFFKQATKKGGDENSLNNIKLNR